MLSAGARRRRGGRFSLLYLDDDDHYLEDHGARLLPCAALWEALGHAGGGAPPPLKGRLRVSTRALFFEPDDALVPVLRFPFAQLRALETLSEPELAHGVQLSAGLCTELHARRPFAFLKGAWLPRVQLLHTPLAQVLPLLERLHALARGPRPEVGLEAVVEERAAGFGFDGTWLSDAVSETIVAEQRVRWVTPLVGAPGVLALTKRGLYFQCMHTVDSEPQARWPVGAVCGVERKRHLLRHTALEIRFTPAHGGSAGAGAELARGGAPAQLGGGCGGCGADEGVRSALLSSPAPPSELPPAESESALFAFQSQAERDAFAAQLLALRDGAAGAKAGAAGPSCDGGSGAPPPPAAGAAEERARRFAEAEARELDAAQRAWLCGALSSFDYLMALNQLSGRSAHDLSQYPVLPWVLSDYESETVDLAQPSAYRDLSKPVGALNAARLAQFRERYRESALAAAADGSADEPEGSCGAGDASGGGCGLGAAPFMYGTHYSSAGFVLYYLVRVAPELMLRLQGGKFDEPQRIFHSVRGAWEGVNRSTSDVKELIPEFFAGDGAFLRNGLRLPLGARADGERVGDVRLPPWARSAAEFVAINRAALEGDVASAGLHGWIDLIWGAKQRGQAAVRADNVFYHLTYEGAVDLEAVTDRYSRRALELQVSEFGQTPRQLWADRPHPRRRWPPRPARGLGAGAGAARGSRGSGADSEAEAEAEVEAEAEAARAAHGGSEGAAASTRASRLGQGLAALLPASALGDLRKRLAAGGGARDGGGGAVEESGGGGVGEVGRAQWLPRWLGGGGGSIAAQTQQPPQPQPQQSPRAARRSRLQLCAELRAPATPLAAAASADGAELFVCDARGDVSLFALGECRRLYTQPACAGGAALSAAACVRAAAPAPAVGGGGLGEGSVGAAWAGTSDGRLLCVSARAPAAGTVGSAAEATPPRNGAGGREGSGSLPAAASALAAAAMGLAAGAAAGARAHTGAISALIATHAPLSGAGGGSGSAGGGPGCARLVSGGSDGCVKLWDCAADGGSRAALLCALGEHDGRVSALGCCEREGSSLVASGAADGTLTLWDARSGDGPCRNLAPGTAEVRGLAVVDCGRYVLCCSGGPEPRGGWAAGAQPRLRLLSAHNGREVASAALPCSAECMLLLGSTILLGLADGGVRVSAWSGAGVGGPFEVARAGAAPVVAIVRGARAPSGDCVCVVSADGCVRHYAVDTSVPLELGGVA